MVKRQSLEQSNPSPSSLPSQQSVQTSGACASGGGGATGSQPTNSFEKFSKSNGYYSQVLRVSWNIIGKNLN